MGLEFVGFPGAEGAFTSGGMISNLTAILVARERALPGCRHEGFAGRRGTVYCSEEAHHSVVRAVEAAGLGSDNVRPIPIGPDRRLPADALDAAIAADREAGRIPVAVIANGGTTLTGTVDPIAEVAEVCEEHGVWLHVDGAYGLPRPAPSAPARCSQGIERADSDDPRRPQVARPAEELQRRADPGARPAGGDLRPRGVLHAQGRLGPRTPSSARSSTRARCAR